MWNLSRNLNEKWINEKRCNNEHGLKNKNKVSMITRQKDRQRGEKYENADHWKIYSESSNNNSKHQPINYIL